jgi:hypothetical protein
MRIDKNLNIVIPVTRADGAQIFVHSAPISSDVFDTYFLVISKTFAAVYSEQLGPIAGPRVAHKLLKKVAMEMKVWEGAGGVAKGLVAEMHRLTNVVAPAARGWETIPFDEACARDVLDPTDASEIEGTLTFFTVGSCMYRRAELRENMAVAMEIWGARIESLDCTEFINSLPTSIGGGNTGVRAVG